MLVVEFLTKSKLKELGLDGLLGGFSFSMNFKDVSVEEFMKMQDKDFDNLRNIGKAKKNAVIWLRDYLNGKVNGKYEKGKQTDNIEIIQLREKIRGQKGECYFLCIQLKMRRRYKSMRII